MQVNISGRMRLRFVKMVLKLDGQAIDHVAKHFTGDGHAKDKHSKHFPTSLLQGLGVINEKRVMDDPTNPNIEKSHR